ncbi:MAG TPA: 2-amino-4-hydroxy-6-hydroxymethyldihydropteridine diphosphokinase [Segetibacter sp.]|jgi:2-amino-4-hydroxy-6-hydroxymethyldihydropteridine diphosphokinase
MNQAFLLTGGNIGDRLNNLQKAAEAIEKQAGKIIKKSALYETAAWGKTDQSSFLNQVLGISTTLSATDLLATLLAIELELGRQRYEKMGPRTIDIDILFYNNDCINTKNLKVPHPQIAFRRFVLTPLNEIAPHFVHPVSGKTIKELLLECPDNLEVIKY